MKRRRSCSRCRCWPCACAEGGAVERRSRLGPRRSDRRAARAGGRRTHRARSPSRKAIASSRTRSSCSSMARDLELAAERAKAERSQAEAQLALLAGRLAPRGHRPGAGAGAGGARRGGGGSCGTERGRSGPRALRSAAARQRRLAQAAGRCRDEAGCGARARAGRGEPRARRGAVDGAAACPAPGRRKSPRRARASPRPPRRWPPSRSRSATRRCARRLRASSPRSSSRVGEMIAPRTPAVVITDLAHAWADVFVPEPVDSAHPPRADARRCSPTPAAPASRAP